MSNYQRKGSHTVSRLSCHIVWSTKLLPKLKKRRQYESKKWKMVYR